MNSRLNGNRADPQSGPCEGGMVRSRKALTAAGAGRASDFAAESEPETPPWAAIRYRNGIQIGNVSVLIESQPQKGCT